MTYFVMTCARTGETMEYHACERHAERIVVDGDNVQAYDCDDDIACDECEALAIARRKKALANGGWERCGEWVTTGAVVNGEWRPDDNGEWREGK